MYRQGSKRDKEFPIAIPNKNIHRTNKQVWRIKVNVKGLLHEQTKFHKLWTKLETKQILEH